MRGPDRPHTTQTSQPSALNRGATITAACALTGLASTLDKQAPSGEP
jgi:hypothetical protein